MSVVCLSRPSGPGALGAAPWAGESDPRSFPLCCLPYLGPSCRHGGRSSQPSIWGPHLRGQGQPALTSSPVCPCLNVFHYHCPHPPHCIPPHARNWLLPESPQLSLLLSPGNVLSPNLSWQSEPKAAASRKAFPVCCHDPMGPGRGQWTVVPGQAGLPPPGTGGHITSPLVASVFTPLQWEQHKSRLSDLLGMSPATAVLSPTHPTLSGFGFQLPPLREAHKDQRGAPQ